MRTFRLSLWERKMQNCRYFCSCCSWRLSWAIKYLCDIFKIYLLRSLIVDEIDKLHVDCTVSNLRISRLRTIITWQLSKPHKLLDTEIDSVTIKLYNVEYFHLQRERKKKNVSIRCGKNVLQIAVMCNKNLNRTKKGASCQSHPNKSIKLATLILSKTAWAHISVAKMNVIWHSLTPWAQTFFFWQMEKYGVEREIQTIAYAKQPNRTFRAN